MLSSGTSELVSVISSPTAVTSRQPTEPGAVLSSKVTSPAAMSAAPLNAHVIRVIGSPPSPSAVVADELWRSRRTALPPAVTSSPRPVVAHSPGGQGGQVVECPAELCGRDLREVDDVVDLDAGRARRGSRCSG